MALPLPEFCLRGGTIGSLPIVFDVGGTAGSGLFFISSSPKFTLMVGCFGVACSGVACSGVACSGSIGIKGKSVLADSDGGGVGTGLDSGVGLITGFGGTGGVGAGGVIGVGLAVGSGLIGT